MPTITEGKRLAKRIMLTNLLTNDYNLALTPLLSGKHGIGKSQVAKSIAKDLNGICITIEGGTLKEGEITGIPYQYRNSKGEVEFKFLPYYVVERIQNAEKFLNRELIKEESLQTHLEGTDNKYSCNELTLEEKIKLIEERKVKPVILFFDEINRTENAVFRELMNIILTKTVNGYQFPWWVFIIAAMNPSTQNSIYATNEMDPAQLDRFIKIKVRENADEWINYALDNEFDKTIIDFIANNQKCLSKDGNELEDEDTPTPSPRGWNMVDLIIKGKDKLDNFFTKEEQSKKDKDIRTIITSKVGSEASTMYYSSLKDKSKIVSAKEIFNLEIDGIKEELKEIIKNQSTARNSITSKDIISYLVNNLDTYLNDNKTLSIINKKLYIYLNLLDSSSKLLLSQNLVSATTKNGKEIFDYIYDIFDQEILDLLEFSNLNNLKITNEQ